MFIIWGVFIREIWRESFSGVRVYVPFMFSFLSGAIPCAPSHFTPMWLPVRPPCFVSCWLSHFINIFFFFFTVLSGNYKVMTAAPNGTIFRARQHLKPPLKMTLWSRFLNSQLCEKWQNTIMQQEMQVWNAPGKLLMAWMFLHKMCSPLTLLCCQHFYWFYILGQLHAPKL